MNIAIYTRKSVHVENSESIETQISMCKNYFKDAKYEVFEDEGFSGGNTNRPAFKRLLALCKMKKFDAVAVYKVDRIARNIVDFMKIFEELDNLGIKLISVTEGFDPSTPIGKLMMIMLASFADMERENIRQRVKDNMLSLAKKSCYTGGGVPFGCAAVEKQNKKYIEIINKGQIEIIFNTYLKVGSLYATCLHTKSLGIKLTKEGIRVLLKNPIYVKSCKEVSDYLSLQGYEVIGKEDNQCGYVTYGKNVKTPIAVINKCKGVIDSTIFLKTQILLEKNANEFKKKSQDNWLSNILKCPNCGAPYLLVFANGKKYYACKNRTNRTSMGIDKTKAKCPNKKYIRSEILEERVSKFIRILEDREIFETYYNKQLTSNDTSNIEYLENKIKENESAINSLVDKLILLNTSASEKVVERINAITLENNTLKSKLEVEKLLYLQNNANTLLKDEQYKELVAFCNLDSSAEKRNKISRIFNKIIYDPIEDRLIYVF